MLHRPLPGTRYGVFVRFRKSRLPLRRGIASLDEATLAAEALRRERLHGKNDVFIVREPDGAVIELPALPVDPPAERGLATLAPIAPPAPAPALAAPISASWAQAEASLHARIEPAQRAMARAAEARARFDRSAQALGAALQRPDAPAALVEHHARTMALRALTARALASFEAATAVVAALAGRPPVVAGAPREGARV